MEGGDPGRSETSEVGGVWKAGPLCMEIWHLEPTRAVLHGGEAPGLTLEEGSDSCGYNI